MKKIFLLLFLCGFQLQAQNFTLKKATVMDPIALRDSSSQSFAIYLPSSFDTKKPNRVLFIFDPEGRGGKLVQLFKTAAEEQQYMLIGSNDIDKKNSLTQNLEIASNLINRVSAMFPITKSSIVVAGLGDGAKVASSLPVLFPDISGVISVGFHNINMDFLKNTQKFTFAGMTGNNEIASYGLAESIQQLNKRDFPSVFYTYPQGKDWPNSQLLGSALGFISLQAMRENRRSKSDELVDKLYRQDEAYLKKYFRKKNDFLAMNLLETMERKYNGLKNISQLKQHQKDLLKSDSYQKYVLRYARLREKENQRLEDLSYYLEQDITNANFDNLGWWNFQSQELDTLNSSKDPLEVAMGARLLDFIDLVLQSNLESFKTHPVTLEQELFANMLQTVFDSQNFGAYKKVISLSAKDNDFSTALFYLEEMLKNGYQDKDSLYQLEGTLGLKITPEYNWLIKKYLGSSQFFENYNPVFQRMKEKNLQKAGQNKAQKDGKDS